jgi:hypothetical protein
MRIPLLLLVLATLSCATATEFDLDDPHYERCGSSYCLGGSGLTSKGVANDLINLGPNLEERYMPLRGVDAKNFRELGFGWATDGAHVWCGRTSPVARAADHRTLGGPFHAIGKQVWWRCTPLGAFEPALGKPGPVTTDVFQSIGCGLGRLGSHVVRKKGGDVLVAGRLYRELTVVPDLDAATLEVDAQCHGRDSRIEFTVSDGDLSNMRPRNPGDATMKAFPCGYLLRDGVISLDESPLAGADPGTFEVIIADCAAPWARDRNHVWSGRSVVGDAGPGFLIIERTGRSFIARDEHHVFLSGAILKGADPASFEVLDHIQPGGRNIIPISRDATHVYYDTDVIEGADPSTFVLLKPKRQCPHTDYGFSRDARHVYLGRTTLADADPASFELVEPPPGDSDCFTGFYARDAHNLWYRGRRLDVDFTTFVMHPNGDAEDKDHVFGRWGDISFKAHPKPCVTPPCHP